MLCLHDRSFWSRLLITATFAMSMFPSLLTTERAWAAEDKVVSVPSDDTEMNAAIAKARASLPAFWEKLEHASGGEQGFSVKLKISDSGHDEHFWCNDIQGNSEKATCVIDNDPQFVKTVHAGQRVEVDNNMITDWLYLRDDLIFGGETIRVLLKLLPPEEAEGLRARLSKE
jgi:uncharacterized protein YegJ (DUF2314 family)